MANNIKYKDKLNLEIKMVKNHFSTFKSFDFKVLTLSKQMKEYECKKDS